MLYGRGSGDMSLFRATGDGEADVKERQVARRPAVKVAEERRMVERKILSGWTLVGRRYTSRTRLTETFSRIYIGFFSSTCSFSQSRCPSCPADGVVGLCLIAGRQDT